MMLTLRGTLACSLCFRCDARVLCMLERVSEVFFNGSVDGFHMLPQSSLAIANACSGSANYKCFFSGS